MAAVNLSFSFRTPSTSRSTSARLFFSFKGIILWVMRLTGNYSWGTGQVLPAVTNDFLFHVPYSEGLIFTYLHSFYLLTSFLFYSMSLRFQVPGLMSSWFNLFWGRGREEPLERSSMKVILFPCKYIEECLEDQELKLFSLCQQMSWAWKPSSLLLSGSIFWSRFIQSFPASH